MTLTASTTLRDLTGMPSEPSAISDAALIIIDAQNTYTEGVMKLEGVQDAITECRKLLDAARAAKRPIFHIVHNAGPGTPYDTEATIGQIVDLLKPQEGEPVISKNVPSSFTGTDLHEKLQAIGAKELILCGFMTHMCVSSTARSGFELGYRCTVVEDATATRNLPSASHREGSVMDAQNLKENSLCAIADMFAVVVKSASDLKN